MIAMWFDSVLGGLMRFHCGATEDEEPGEWEDPTDEPPLGPEPK